MWQHVAFEVYSIGQMLGYVYLQGLPMTIETIMQFMWWIFSCDGYFRVVDTLVYYLLYHFHVLLKRWALKVALKSY